MVFVGIQAGQPDGQDGQPHLEASNKGRLDVQEADAFRHDGQDQCSHRALDANAQVVVIVRIGAAVGPCGIRRFSLNGRRIEAGMADGGLGQSDGCCMPVDRQGECGQIETQGLDAGDRVERAANL